MRPVLNRTQIRAFDQHAVQRCCVPSALLMENAARGAADFLLQGGYAEHTVCVLCGPGNNGGDGWALARRLLTVGRQVEVVSIVELSALRGDAAVMFEAYRGCGGRFRVQTGSEPLNLNGAGTIVDALFGTGLTRALDGWAAEVVRVINETPARILALDIPSGLDADTGQIHGLCVQAQATVTFAAPKLGLYTPNGERFAGVLHVADIGVPGTPIIAAVGYSARCLESEDVEAWVKRIPQARHKGEAGRVLVVAGSPGSTGAARLVAHAALRAGSGSVTIGVRPDCSEAIEQSAWESMVRRMDASDLRASLGTALSGADCVAIGPGLGLDALGAEITRRLVLQHPGQMVLDADALTHFSGAADELRACPGPRLLTPHPAEAARLLGVTTAEIEADRFLAVQQLANATQATVLLKGVRTLICEPDGVPLVNPRGASTLATAGSGDVLTGVVAALACHLEALPALACGAWLHAVAGERLAQGGKRGALAREIGDAIPAEMAAFTSR